VRIDPPLGQAAIVERLWSAAVRGRLPHALSFEGPEGIGKFHAVRWFAAGLLCEHGPAAPCGVCGPCKRVASGGARGNHPDLLPIDPLEEDEETIRVNRIARRDGGEEGDGSVEAFLALRPMEGHGRVVILRESHRMNAAAQNALLKTLEEPRPGTHLVLETHRPDALLSTILSRCVRLRFEPLSRADCRHVLAASGIEGERAERLARWTEGSPGRALALAARGIEEMRAHLADLLLGRVPAQRTAARLQEVEGEFHGARPTQKARDRARTVLDLELALLRDLRRARAGADPALLPHGELAELLAEAGRLPTERGLARRTERVLESRSDVARNLTPDALIERTLFQLADPSPTGSARLGG